MRVSVIATVFNERATIGRLLDSLAAQSRSPDEVVICDGGSVDGTVEVIRAYARTQQKRLPALQVVSEPGANISRGRNVAIDAAQGPIIAATDAGVRLEPDWLEKITAPWEQPGEPPLAVAGLFVPDSEGVFQTAMAATVLPLVDEIDPTRFLPSSRSVAFTKASWAQAGGYPEWLDYCEDLVFDFAMNAQRPDQPTAFAWAPDAIVHFRPRGNLRQFWTQYYRYARGDGKADLWRKRHAIRYATYLGALPLLVGHAFFGVAARWLGWVGLLIGIALYCRRPWQRLGVIGKELGLLQRLAATALVPVIRATGDLAKMAGYPVGVWWRWRQGERIHRMAGRIPGGPSGPRA